MLLKLSWNANEYIFHFVICQLRKDIKIREFSDQFSLKKQIEYKKNTCNNIYQEQAEK